MTTDRSDRLFAGAVAENAGDFAPRDWFLFTGISLIWGSSFLFIAYALEGLTPGMVTLGRVGLGALALGCIRLLGPRRAGIDRSDRARVAALAVIWVAVPFTLFPLAQQYINSAVTGLLNGAMPVFAALVSTVFAKTAPRPVQMVGLALGFGGITVISLASGGGESSEAVGVGLVLAATVCYGFAVNLAAPLQARYGAVTLMSTVLAVATVLVVPFGLWDLGANEIAAGPIASVVFLGAVGTGFAYWIMASLVGRVGAIRAAFITYLIPPVSLVLGVVVRGDEVAALALVGAGLTIGGALLASRRPGAPDDAGQLRKSRTTSR